MEVYIAYKYRALSQVVRKLGSEHRVSPDMLFLDSEGFIGTLLKAQECQLKEVISILYDSPI